MEKTFWQNLKMILIHYRWRFAKALLMVMIANGLLILTPVIFRYAVMAMSTPETAQSDTIEQWFFRFLGSFRHSIAAWAVLLLFFATVSSFFKYQMRVAFISISRDVEREVRSKLFSRIQEQSMAFYDQHGIGELLSRLTNDIAAYRDVLGPGIMYPLFFLTLVIPGFIALFFISPQLATISLIPLFVIPLVNLATRRKIYALSHRVQKGLADLSNMTQENYAGIRIIKGYCAESQLLKRFLSLCQALISSNIYLNCFQGMLYPFFTLLTKVITLALVICTGLVVLKGMGQLSAADFVSYMWIQSYIFFPILMLAWVLPIYERGRAAYERLVEIYEAPIEVCDKSEEPLMIPQKAEIAFHHLTFSYPEISRPVLDDFSLQIRGGTFVGITGPVGSGKTTLFRILNREYEVPYEKVFIDGRDIHEYPLHSIWKEIVTVEQIPFLFSRTIADNVRFGKEEALQKDIEMVSKYADLHETITGFPEQYQTMVGERGVTLSGGQKQRLAMARAFLVNRSILLLDDVFSAVDTDTEMRIFIAMQSNLRNKTVLLITHRVSILEAMDRVIYMQNGKIVEDGSPIDLKAQKGLYAALVELQGMHQHGP